MDDKLNMFNDKDMDQVNGGMFLGGMPRTMERRMRGMGQTDGQAQTLEINPEMPGGAPEILGAGFPRPQPIPFNPEIKYKDGGQC